MKERRIASENEYSSHLAIKADVGCIIVSTTTPDYAFPSVACQVQEYFDIPNTGALDYNATCAGFTYGLHMGNAFITSGLHKKVLVISYKHIKNNLVTKDILVAKLFFSLFIIIGKLNGKLLRRNFVTNKPKYKRTAYQH